MREHEGGRMMEGCRKYVETVAPPPRARRKGGVMWLLLIVLLNMAPGFSKSTVLGTYATAEECQSERNRIGFEMAAAYPNERDFVVVCQLRPKDAL
jgi:hypothetical protein